MRQAQPTALLAPARRQPPPPPPPARHRRRNRWHGVWMRASLLWRHCLPSRCRHHVLAPPPQAFVLAWAKSVGTGREVLDGGAMAEAVRFLLRLSLGALSMTRPCRVGRAAVIRFHRWVLLLFACCLARSVRQNPSTNGVLTNGVLLSLTIA
jgi:hypothetical protein